MKTKLHFLLSILVSTVGIHSVSAQAQDQHSALRAIGEGSVFKNFWGISTSGGATTGQASSYQYELKFENNVLDKMSTFVMNKVGTDEAKINSGFGYLEPNHYTKPSVIYNEDNYLGYVYIDGIMYALKGIKDPQNITSFKIDEIYVLMKAAQGEHTSGKVALKEMKSRDHEAVIKQYLADMKKTQENATANFSEEVKNEIAIIEQAKIDKEAGIQAKNAAYWNSEEGKRKLGEMRQEDVTLVNDTQGDLYLCYGSGAYKALKPGEKTTFSCLGGKVNRGTLRPNNNSQYDKTDNVLLDLDGNNCGRTVNASTVIH